LFSQLSFTFNYVSLYSAEFLQNDFSVHRATAATCKFVDYVKRMRKTEFLPRVRHLREVHPSRCGAVRAKLRISETGGAVA